MKQKDIEKKIEGSYTPVGKLSYLHEVETKHPGLLSDETREAFDSIRKKYNGKVQERYYELMKEKRFGKLGDIFKDTYVKQNDGNLQKAYNRLGKEGLFREIKEGSETTGIKPKIEEKVTQEGYIKDFEQENFDGIEYGIEITGIKPKINKQRIKKKQKQIFKRGKLSWLSDLERILNVDKLKFKEEDIQKIYNNIAEKGMKEKSKDIIDISRAFLDMIEIYNYSKIKPKGKAEERIQETYSNMMNESIDGLSTDIDLRRRFNSIRDIIDFTKIRPRGEAEKKIQETYNNIIRFIANTKFSNSKFELPYEDSQYKETKKILEAMAEGIDSIGIEPKYDEKTIESMQTIYSEMSKGLNYTDFSTGPGTYLTSFYRNDKLDLIREGINITEIKPKEKILKDILYGVISDYNGSTKEYIEEMRELVGKRSTNKTIRKVYDIIAEWDGGEIKIRDSLDIIDVKPKVETLNKLCAHAVKYDRSIVAKQLIERTGIEPNKENILKVYSKLAYDEDYFYGIPAIKSAMENIGIEPEDPKILKKVAKIYGEENEPRKALRLRRKIKRLENK